MCNNWNWLLPVLLQQPELFLYWVRKLYHIIQSTVTDSTTRRSRSWTVYAHTNLQNLCFCLLQPRWKAKLDSRCCATLQSKTKHFFEPFPQATSVRLGFLHTSTPTQYHHLQSTGFQEGRTPLMSLSMLQLSSHLCNTADKSTVWLCIDLHMCITGVLLTIIF